MKKLLFGLAGLAVLGALALDNTIINEYWNTTGYVNYEPSEQTATNASDVDVVVKAVAVAVNVDEFSTDATGLCIFVR